MKVVLHPLAVENLARRWYTRNLGTAIPLSFSPQSRLGVHRSPRVFSTVDAQAESTEAVGCIAGAAFLAAVGYAGIAVYGALWGPVLLCLALGPALWFLGVATVPDVVYDATVPVTTLLFFLGTLLVPGFGAEERLLALGLFVASFFIGIVNSAAAAVFMASFESGEAEAIHPLFAVVVWTYAAIWLLSPIFALVRKHERPA